MPWLENTLPPFERVHANRRTHTSLTHSPNHTHHIRAFCYRTLRMFPEHNITPLSHNHLHPHHALQIMQKMAWRSGTDARMYIVYVQCYTSSSRARPCSRSRNAWKWVRARSQAWKRFVFARFHQRERCTQSNSSCSAFAELRVAPGVCWCCTGVFVRYGAVGNMLDVWTHGGSVCTIAIVIGFRERERRTVSGRRSVGYGTTDAASASATGLVAELKDCDTDEYWLKYRIQCFVLRMHKCWMVCGVE